jgi:hypothetical protein
MNDRRIISRILLLAVASLSSSFVALAQDVPSIDKWQKKGDYEYHVFKLKPTDWPQALKTDPVNCGLTAAQAAKYECKTITYEGRPYYYYTVENGSVYARRPVVTVYKSTPEPK